MTPDASEAIVQIAETQPNPAEIVEAHRLLAEGKTTRALIATAHALRWACERTSPPPRLAAWVEGGASPNREALAIAVKGIDPETLAEELGDAVDATLAALSERSPR